MKEIGYPASSDKPAVTTFAEAPMSVPLPPRQAPKARAQISGPRSRLRSTERESTIGIIVAVYGMLSMKAEATAETHNMMTTAAASRYS